LYAIVRSEGETDAGRWPFFAHHEGCHKFTFLVAPGYKHTSSLAHGPRPPPRRLCAPMNTSRPHLCIPIRGFSAARSVFRKIWAGLINMYGRARRCGWPVFLALVLFQLPPRKCGYSLAGEPPFPSPLGLPILPMSPRNIFHFLTATGGLTRLCRRARVVPGATAGLAYFFPRTSRFIGGSVRALSATAHELNGDGSLYSDVVCYETMKSMSLIYI
jgi:hypothetical protein